MICCKPTSNLQELVSSKACMRTWCLMCLLNHSTHSPHRAVYVEPSEQRHATHARRALRAGHCCFQFHPQTDCFATTELSWAKSEHSGLQDTVVTLDYFRLLRSELLRFWILRVGTIPPSQSSSDCLNISQSWNRWWAASLFPRSHGIDQKSSRSHPAWDGSLPPKSLKKEELHSTARFRGFRGYAFSGFSNASSGLLWSAVGNCAENLNIS